MLLDRSADCGRQALLAFLARERERSNRRTRSPDRRNAEIGRPVRPADVRATFVSSLSLPPRNLPPSEASDIFDHCPTLQHLPGMFHTRPKSSDSYAETYVSGQMEKVLTSDFNIKCAIRTHARVFRQAKTITPARII